MFACFWACTRLGGATTTTVRRNQSGQKIQLKIQKLVHTFYAQSDVTKWIKAGHASWFKHLEV